MQPPLLSLALVISSFILAVSSIRAGATSAALITSARLRQQQYSRTTTTTTTTLLMSSSKRPSPQGRVAIVGAGISGLACARELKAQGMDVLLFDTGRLAPGGRCSSKTVLVDAGKGVLFDHSAQFLSSPITSTSSLSNPLSPSSTWDQWVQEMEAHGVLREWDSERIGTLQKGGKFTPRASINNLPQPRALVSPHGMRAIPTYLAKGLQIDRPKWVSKAKHNPVNGLWSLWHYQEQLDDFEYLVVAHNGKCAARLAKSAGEALAPVARLLETKFGASLRGGPVPRYMQLCSLYVLMVVLDRPVTLSGGATFEGAFVEDVPELSWVADQGAKMGQDVGGGEGGREAGRSAWVLVSSPGFAEQHKVPQENIPKEKAAEVTKLMLRAFQQAVGKEGVSPSTPPLVPVASALQLWGAGNPISVADVSNDAPFLFQAATGCGVCGDWLISPSIPAAATSGIALARHIAKHHAAKKESTEGRREGEEDGGVLREDVGLGCGFKPVRGARPIAAFPGDKAPATAPPGPRQGGGGTPRGGRGGGGGGGGNRGGGGRGSRPRQSPRPPPQQQQQVKT